MNNLSKKDAGLSLYHMLEHLLKLRVRMISTSFDIVVCKSISKTFVKLLQYLSQANCIQLNKIQELQKILSHFSISFS